MDNDASSYQGQYHLEGKRAVVLLRASSAKQVTKIDHDIPAQRQIVAEFIQKEELIQVREFVEAAISGFKVKFIDRDALLEIKDMAERKEFDVLVIYYSDRIGRNSDESPWVIKYLNKKGVRVFSVKEGEIKTQTQIDKLFTWMKFWQAENESVKIAHRSTDYRINMVQNGRFQGGGGKTVPYGYRTVDKGSKNAKGRNILDFEINPEEADIIRLVYKLSIENNMGARAITNYLNEREEYRQLSKGSQGFNFRNIQYWFVNPMYRGYFHMHSKIRGKEIFSPKQENLVIVSDEMYERHLMALEGRKIKGAKSYTKGATISKNLLSGLVYCGHCNDKLHVWANHKRKNKDGAAYITYCYRCKTKLISKGINECKGQSTYSCVKIDVMVENEIISFIRNISHKKLSNTFYQKLYCNLESLNNSKKEMSMLLVMKQKHLICMKKEIGNLLTIESTWISQLLNENIVLMQDDVTQLMEKIKTIDTDIKRSMMALDEYNILDNNLSEWEKRYQEADIMGKKALISQVVERITIHRDSVDIEYKATINAFNQNSIVNAI